MRIRIYQRIVMMMAATIMGFQAMFPPWSPREGNEYAHTEHGFLFQQFEASNGCCFSVDAGQLLAELTVVAAAALFFFLAAGLSWNEGEELGRDVPA